MGNIPLPALGIQPPQQENPVNNLARLLQVKNEMAVAPLQRQALVQSLQTGALENQQRQLQLQDQFKLRQVATDPSIDWTQPGAYDQMFQKATQAGVSPQTLLPIQSQIVGMKQKLAETNKDELSNMVTQNDQRRGKLLSIIQEKDPQQKQASWDQELTNEEKSGAIQPGQINHQYPGDDTAKMFADHLAQGSVLAKEAIDQQAAQARLASALKPTQDTLAAAAAKGDKDAANALAMLNQVAVNKAANVKQAELNVENAPGNVAASANTAAARAAGTARGTMSVTGTLDPVALDQAAARYAQTGVMPPMGMGSAGALIRRQIMNRAGELYPSGSLAKNSAEFEANKRSLENVQKISDQVGAFENTAGKNLDQFLSQAQKVIDTGNPLLNRPVRLITGEMGGKDQATFNAARTVALTEISKVLNSANASNVVSDAARKEVEGLIGPNATLGQITSAAKILRTDMQNRAQAYNEQISDIKGRIGGGKSIQSAPASSNPPPGSTGIAKGSDGNWYYHDAKGGILGQAPKQ